MNYYRINGIMWLYQSKAYSVMSVLISLTAIIVGIILNAIAVSIIMILFEIIFSIWLVVENKSLNDKTCVKLTE